MSDRYSAPGPEGEYEPGSRRRVLRNLVGIKSSREMARRESDSLVLATRTISGNTRLDQCFSANDISSIHKQWLGGIYAWAGQYRTVNISKGDFLFAASAQVPRLMSALESGPLRQYTPCRYTTIDEQSHALAVVHVELVLIHPFRDGNGRCARLLAVLMGLQAGLPPLNFGGIQRQEKRRYISAVQAGLSRNYEPMKEVFRRVIKRSLRLNARV